MYPARLLSLQKIAKITKGQKIHPILNILNFYRHKMLKLHLGLNIKTDHNFVYKILLLGYLKSDKLQVSV